MQAARSILKKNAFIYYSVKNYRSYPTSRWQFAWSFLKNGAWRLGNRLLGGAPIPDPHLAYLVAGTDNVRWFLYAGRKGAQSIHSVLQRNGISWHQMIAVLDFGCGAGRVIRHFRNLQGPEFFGTDINEQLIAWCQQNLKFARFQTNTLSGKLDYPDEQFDFVYALSVFTHLTEPLQCFWKAELGRILKPGGYLLITTHGDYYQKELLPEGLEKYLRGELVVYGADQDGTNRCAAFHPASYVREKLAGNYQILDFIPEGAAGNPWQDLWLLQKPAAG